MIHCRLKGEGVYPPIHRLCDILTECTFIDGRGAVGIRLEPAAAIVRHYGEQFRAPRRRRRPRSIKPLVRSNLPASFGHIFCND
jgi:hypothetical protein